MLITMHEAPKVSAIKVTGEGYPMSRQLPLIPYAP